MVFDAPLWVLLAAELQCTIQGFKKKGKKPCEFFTLRNNIKIRIILANMVEFNIHWGKDPSGWMLKAFLDIVS